MAALGPGDHLCCLFETEEEHRAVLTPFFRQGLEGGEKVLYIVDIRKADTILDYLRDGGLDVEPYLARGQLVILNRNDAYIREGVFDPDGMIGLLRTETERALAEGYMVLRVTGEMTWALQGFPGSERLIEYETKLNELLPGSRCLAICQYDRRRFEPTALLDVLHTHPIAVIGTEVCENFYYIPPPELQKGQPAAATLRNSLKYLVERRRADEALWNRTHQLGERLKELNCLYAISTLVDQPGISLEEIAQGTADFIPPSWQYPNVTCARIILGDHEFKTENFRETAWRQASDVKARGERIGGVDVCYLEERAECDEGPFLKEERNLINAIAERLGRITERMWAEQAIRESEERYRTLYDNTPVMMHSIDRDGRLISVNNHWLKSLGYELSEVIGRSSTDFLTEASRRYATEVSLPEFFKTGIAKEVEYQMVTKSGEVRDVLLSAIGERDKAGELSRTLAFVVDVTEHKQGEEALRRLNKKLEEANRHKSEFLANLSHELRTPLNAILGASELLAEGVFGGLTEKQGEYVWDIHESGNHLLSLINDVLDLSKVEAGKLDLHLDHLSLRSLMESSAVIVRERAASKSIEFKVIPPPEEVVVEADQRKIKQIVYNLLSNAVKFTPENGSVVFSAHRAGGDVIFTVEDTGPGVAEEFRERIFDEFFQGPGDQEGTGLGLTVAKRLAELHRGHIWLESEVGQGSRFFFAIPIVARHAPTGSGTQ
jgi:PAS domain S-box-containing protein